MLMRPHTTGNVIQHGDRIQNEWTLVQHDAFGALRHRGIGHFRQLGALEIKQVFPDRMPCQYCHLLCFVLPYSLSGGFCDGSADPPGSKSFFFAGVKTISTSDGSILSISICALCTAMPTRSIAFIAILPDCCATSTHAIMACKSFLVISMLLVLDNVIVNFVRR